VCNFESMKNIILSALLFFSFSSFTQIGMNKWRIHFSAYSSVGVAETQNAVFMACQNGLTKFDLEDNSVSEITVTNGLSDLGVSAIGSAENVVAVGYGNGNLDIIEGNTVTNVPWIKAAEIGGDKTINNFFFSEDYIYISTSLGLVLFDNDKKEIKDTYYPYENPVIYDATIYEDTIFVATANGIYFAHKNRPFLNDINQWTKKTDMPAGLLSAPIAAIESFGDKLFFAYDDELFNGDTLYYIKDGSITKFKTGISLLDIYANNERLVISQFSTIQSLNTTLEEEMIIFDYPFETPSPVAALFKNGDFWIADKTSGMVRAQNSWSAQAISNNSPATDGCYRMDIQYGKVLIAGGGLTFNLKNNFFRNGVYVFEDETWTNYNSNTQDSIDFDKNWDFISVGINTNNTDEFAFSSFSEGGLFVVKDNKNISEHYTEQNSLIELFNGKITIGDIKFDNEGNLWILNQGLFPLKVFTKDGQQYEYDLGSNAKNKFPLRLIIDSDGNKWAGFSGGGLVAFNENGTFDNPEDDQLQTLNATEGSGNLPSTTVQGIIEDADGEIWIGTSSGLVVLYSKNRLYDGNFGEYDATSIRLEVDGEIERLFGETSITAVAVDGGNRKWIGTSSAGVFCVSPDGYDEIYQFTAENSPLVSNNILDIQVDQLSGEVYFATDQGIVSFRADATLADNEFSQVKVFPNPVRPEFSGPITIQGLGYESDVKITDVSGNLIYKTVSNGGTVIWNGKTLYGERVQSGVYLVWSGVVTGKGKNVAKILFIN
jgi:ligand-binding sensor domain-containing protein